MKKQKKYYFSIMKKYYPCFSDIEPQGIEIIMFGTPVFKFKWFTDCGEWFIYLIFGKSGKYIRFSSVGTMSNFIRRWY